MTTHKLLVVDGERNFAEGLVRQLGSIGLEATWTGTMKDGYQTAVSWRPDIVMIDVRLPDGNGFALFTNLKKHPATKGLRFILTSHQEQVFADHKKLKRRANLYIRKPFSIHELRQQLNAAFGWNLPSATEPIHPDDSFDTLESQAPANPKNKAEDDLLGELDHLLSDISPVEPPGRESREADLSELDALLGDMGEAVPPPPPDEPPPLPDEIEAATLPPEPPTEILAESELMGAVAARLSPPPLPEPDFDLAPDRFEAEAKTMSSAKMNELPPEEEAGEELEEIAEAGEEKELLDEAVLDEKPPALPPTPPAHRRSAAAAAPALSTGPDLNVLKEEIARLAGENRRLTEQIAQLAKDSARGRAEMDKYKKALEQAKSQLKDLKSGQAEELHHLKEQVAADKGKSETAYKKEIARLKKELVEAHGREQSVQSDQSVELESVRTEMAELLRKLQQAEALLKERKSDTADLHASLAEMETRLEEATRQHSLEMERLVDEETRKRNEMERRHEHQLANLGTHSETLRGQVESLEHELSGARESLAAVEKQAKEKGSEVKTIETMYKHRIGELERELEHQREANRRNEARVIKAMQKIKADAELRARSEKALALVLTILRGVKNE